MPKLIFVNLPVRDLPRSMAFYEALGFTVNPHFSDETAACMASIKKPWIAYKVMAAGAILPKDAFKYAFDNGADFILAGMFDFQIAEDAKLASAAHLSARTRPRPWCA